MYVNKCLIDTNLYLINQLRNKSMIICIICIIFGTHSHE